MAKLTDATPLPLAEATINPLPHLDISHPLPSQGKVLDEFHLFQNLPTELQDEIWKAAVETNTVLAPKRVIENGLVNWSKQATWSFQGMDPNAIGQTCRNARAVMKKHCITMRGNRDTSITTQGPVIYVNTATTMFVLGDYFTENTSFRDEDVAQMRYIAIEGRHPGYSWIRDPFDLAPGSICVDLELLAKVAVNLKAVFVQSKLCHSAGEDPAYISRQLQMAYLPEPIAITDEIRPLDADLFKYLASFVGYTGPEIDDERRCTYYQYREREYSQIVFVAEDNFADGAPAIHFMPLYSPYRLFYKPANIDRAVEHAACHHELTPRSDVSEDQGNLICRPPKGQTDVRILLTSRQEQMNDFEAAMMPEWIEWL